MKFRARLLTVMLCGLVFVMPSVASARQNTSRGDSRQQAAVVNNANFCSSIDEVSGKIMKNTTLRETRYASSETEKQNTLADTLAKRDAAKLETRGAWDNSRDEVFANLKARTNNAKEVRAVDAFQKSIDAAVATRRQSIDTALDVFRSGVDKTLINRKSEVEDAMKAFRATTDTALSDAKVSCASGTPSTKARQSYITDLTDGKQVFLSAVQTALKSDDTMKKLVNTRDESIEAANTAFKKALNQAEIELKKSFPDA